MLNTKQKKFIESHAGTSLQKINAGHMLYHHLISEHNDGWFIKAFDASLFTDTSKMNEAARYLRKEALVYEHLRNNFYEHIPGIHHFQHDALLLPALTAAKGWYWRAPLDDTDQYIKSVLSALKKLEKIKPHENFKVEPTLEYFWQTGWGNNDTFHKHLETARTRWATELTDKNIQQLESMQKNIVNLRIPAPPASLTLYTSHHDARQSNIAWHPTHGVVIVDWSWASSGLENADTTMFLIDLHKSGHDIKKYLPNYFNIYYASLLMGYWIARINEKSAKGNDTVRMHQLISALAAYELIQSV